MVFLMAVDLESLRVLTAVVKEGSFAKAAEVLNKTQSAVSYQVQKLEQRLGTAVFDRSSYRAELTPVGERILAEGQRLLDQAQYLSTLVEQFSESVMLFHMLFTSTLMIMDTITFIRQLSQVQMPKELVKCSA